MVSASLAASSTSASSSSTTPKSKSLAALAPSTICPRWKGHRKPACETAGLRNNINFDIHYLGFWLAGNGYVPIHSLIEDTATYDQAAEIFDRMSLTPDYPEFLTLPLYEAMA